MTKYVNVYRPDHPLAHHRSGTVHLHRARLYDSIGDGPHTCAICGCEVDWPADSKRQLTVDHIDNDPSNNDLSNLQGTCGPCNQRKAPAWHKDGWLDPTAVRIVRHYLGQGKTSAWVSRLLNVGPTSIGRIKRGESYRRIV